MEIHRNSVISWSRERHKLYFSPLKLPILFYETHCLLGKLINIYVSIAETSLQLNSSPHVVVVQSIRTQILLPIRYPDQKDEGSPPNYLPTCSYPGIPNISEVKKSKVHTMYIVQATLK